MLKTCPTCEARFVDGQHYWATGKPGNPLDLAGLVCNKYGDNRCINPCKGQKGGQAWEERSKNLDALLAEHDLFPNLPKIPAD